MTDRDIEAAADSIADFCDRRADRDAASKEIVALVNRAILAERERWTRLLSSGHIPGAAWGTRFKMVKVDPMYGEESELSVSALTAAIREGGK